MSLRTAIELIEYGPLLFLFDSFECNSFGKISPKGALPAFRKLIDSAIALAFNTDLHFTKALNLAHSLDLHQFWKLHLESIRKAAFISPATQYTFHFGTQTPLSRKKTTTCTLTFSLLPTIHCLPSSPLPVSTMKRSYGRAARGPLRKSLFF